MEQLNRNVSGLNTIYEIQLKSISSQIESIEHINSGLNRIREMYDGSVVDSSVFRNETEKMTRQLAELNQVYSRLLQAMATNNRRSRNNNLNNRCISSHNSPVTNSNISNPMVTNSNNRLRIQTTQ